MLGLWKKTPNKTWYSVFQWEIILRDCVSKCKQYGDDE